MDNEFFDGDKETFEEMKKQINLLLPVCRVCYNTFIAFYREG